MSPRMRLLIAIIFILAASLACSTVRKATPTSVIPTEGFPSNPAGASGSNLSWPAYLPTGIPPFEGNLQDITTFGGLLRLHYTNITIPQLQSYLAKLKQAGYQLHYVVYQLPGVAPINDNDVEKYVREGKFDEVQISGPYQLRILPGESEMDYEITVAPDFADAYATAEAKNMAARIPGPRTVPGAASNPLVWPANLINIVPPPADCALTSVINPPDGSTTISCEMANRDVALAYTQVLQNQGFVEQDRLKGPNGEIITIELTKGNDKIQLLLGSTSSMTVIFTPGVH